MATVIENPVINSPFQEPARHFVFDEDGITNQIADERRRSSYFIPIPLPKKRGVQATLQTSWTAERIQENAFINNVQASVDRWRRGGRIGITPVTRGATGLLDRSDRAPWPGVGPLPDQVVGADPV